MKKTVLSIVLLIAVLSVWVFIGDQRQRTFL